MPDPISLFVPTFRIDECLAAIRECLEKGWTGLGFKTVEFEVARLCRERGLRLILDASHMAGTRLNDRHVGAEVDVSIFSFHAVKNLPTADSGMICFADPTLDTEVRRWTWLGIDKDTYARTH